jgi:predicted dehydrogenase
MNEQPHLSHLTRRSFLKRGALAAGAIGVPSFIPARALGRDGAVAPSNRIVMAGIGIGGRGSGVLGVMLGQPDVQCVAVCDVRKDRREAAKRMVDEKNGDSGCASYSDMTQLLAERTDVEAVLIATGDRWHALASVLAMRAGKDVYCEKPACLTIAQGRRVAETASRYGRVYQTGAQRLSESHHIAAIELARSGRLGAIHTVYADCRWRGGYRRDWLAAEPEPAREDLDWDAWLGPSAWRPYNSGYVHNAGWYDHEDFATDIAQWGAHTVAQALAGLDIGQITAVDFTFGGPDASMVTRLSNGVKLVLYRRPGSVWDPCQYWSGACGERFDGADGWAAAADGYSKPDVSSPALLAESRRLVAEYAARTRRPANHVRDFLDCVRSRRPAVANPGVMFLSMSICLAADICEKLRRNLKFDLAKAEFAGDAEANRLMNRAMRAPFTF